MNIFLHSLHIHHYKKQPSTKTVCSFWFVGLDNVYSHCVLVLYFLVSTCNLCDDLKFRCGFFSRIVISETVWKMVKDHRYFQFTKWMRKASKKLFRLQKYTLEQFHKMLAEKDRLQELFAMPSREQSEKSNIPLLYHDDIFSFQFYLCGHFFAFAHYSFFFQLYLFRILF